MKPAESSGAGGPGGPVRRTGPESPISERFPRAAEHVTRELVDEPELFLNGLTSSSSDDFLAWLVAYLQSTLNVAFAFVGEFWGDEWDQIRTVALHTTDGAQENIQYELIGTPCSNVIGSEFCSYLENVAGHFPEDHMLEDLGIQSYLGIPLTDPSHRPLGIMVLMDTKVMDEQTAQLAEDMMRLFRPRTGTVLTGRRSLRDMGLLAESSTALIEHGRMDLLVTELAHAMHVKMAFVSKFVTPSRLRTVGLCMDGRILDDIEYDVSGTPCEDVHATSQLVITDGVRHRYPDDQFLVEVGAEAYMAFGFCDSSGQPLGHLGVIHDHPLAPELANNSMFRVFSRLAGAELQRQEIERDRMAMEAQLEERRHVESLGVLAGGIAHDFNNLLTGIVGNIELARMAGTSADEVLSYLDASQKASIRAAALCDQMLAYAGNRPSRRSRVDFGSLVRETAELLRVSIGENCELKTNLAEDLPDIDADAVQLQQVVMNLIVNASDAVGDEPGVVTVTTGLRYCESSELESMKFGAGAPPGEYVFVEVNDTGGGMTPEELERAFEPYFSTKGLGRGLGLAALGGIVRGHEGGVVLESEPGKGASFTVYIRALTPAALPATDSRESSAENALNATVLVVDDEQAVRDVTRAILERAGCDVLTADDGFSAVELFREQHQRIGCVVLDLSMPGMDGEETLSKLREIDASVRTVIVSGYAMEDVLGRVKHDGITDFIHKPYRRTDFLETVRKALGAPSN